ncbi:MAG: hypothetical protein KME12_19405 [Trichocoleus desertorum ATA4-8-CV12]|nr:hypothetical protein [Trichocoleus desertorum ATA4-8-CV12]
MPQLLLFGASEDLREPQSPSNPKSTPTQSHSPQAQWIACYVVHQVAIQPEPETANPATLSHPDGACLKRQEPISITDLELEANLCSAACGWVVVLTWFAAPCQSQGGGQ